MTKQRNLTHISYGLETPEDLMGKLLHDAKRVEGEPHRYDLFNFFITAAVMYEWCCKCYHTYPVSRQMIKAATQPPVYDALPIEAASWIADRSCMPDTGQDVRHHIVNALRICIETANASKHFQWLRSSAVSAMEKEPKIKNWSQYFLHRQIRASMWSIPGSTTRCGRCGTSCCSFLRGC